MKNKRSSAKEFFLHLLSMVALYVSAISFTVIGFQLVNIWIPDVVDVFAIESAKGLIRGALSFFIVAFPVYLWSLWYHGKNEKDHHDLWFRKWFVYFTLFVAALIILGSLIALVNVFLDGELTLRFGLKFLILIFVSAAIFGYYLMGEKRYEK